MAYVANSRLPVYRTIYGDGLSDVIQGLFARMAPKIASIAKHVSMKAINVIGKKAPGSFGNIASKTFSAAKERSTWLMQRKPSSVKLPSTEIRPADVSKIISKAVDTKLTALMNQGSVAPGNITANVRTGRGLRSRFRLMKK